jgi:hypothetical protein
MLSECIVLSLNRKFCGFGEKRDSAEILEYRLAKQFEPRVKDGARIAENFGLRRGGALGYPLIVSR